jgi:hypothetical protein
MRSLTTRQPITLSKNNLSPSPPRRKENKRIEKSLRPLRLGVTNFSNVSGNEMHSYDSFTYQARKRAIDTPNVSGWNAFQRWIAGQPATPSLYPTPANYNLWPGAAKHAEKFYSKTLASCSSCEDLLHRQQQFITF